MQHLVNQCNFYNGAFQKAEPVNTIPVFDKYSSVHLAELSLLDEASYDEVVHSAIKGFKIWSETHAGERSNMLLRVADLLELDADAFTELIVREAGKPIQFAHIEVQRAVQTLRIASQEALRIGGEVVPMDFGVGVGKIAQTQRFPRGPVLGFSPFNFPLNLALHKIAPALASGCSIVMKAPPQAPLSLLALCSLFQQAGLPEGVLNAVVCDNTIAARLVRDERFAVFSFTGSDAVGWHLKSLAGKKKVVLELGGNAGVYVDESANLEDAAKQIARSAFMYAGQVCIATQRILVHADIERAFITEILREINAIESGDPANQQVVNGPMISQSAFERCANWIDEAKAAGTEVLSGALAFDASRNIWKPTLLTRVNVSMKVWKDEVFAPVAILDTVRDFDAGISKLNQSRFGLQNAVFTDSVQQAKTAFQQLKSGSVLINSAPGFRMDHMPYGGIKDSGEGLEGIRYTMDEFTTARLLVW
jgi:glyceraldehyde-3-phosphate dehydrogenase (NADP+)